jgi:deoxyribodipyrimidine photo-lyase
VVDERPAVVWFRRDLRVDDNQALAAAVRRHRRVIPLFVVDDVLWPAAGANRRWFLAGAVADLDRRLRGRLVVRRGRPADVIADLAARHDVSAVYRAQDVGPYGRRRDADVERALAPAGVAVVEADTAWAMPPGSVRTRAGDGFKVFTAFRRAWEALTVPMPEPAPARIATVRDVPRDPFPVPGEPTAAHLPTPSAAAAHRTLDAFLDGPVDDYAARRDRPAVDGTSRLSAYLRFGLLHPRQLLHRLDRRRVGHRTFATELVWRDFYADVLHHRPESAWAAWNPAMAAMPTDTGAGADARMRAWCEGRTGYPIVDAGMRQLVTEGWMHNRVRMITASFLVKDLHLDWTRGARFFMEHLVDGDLSSNNHGWQWVAGTGTDAAPYFRVFNPTHQSARFDPAGDYLRRWLPELADVAAPEIHAPAEPPAGYVAPIVDHAAERVEALARYAARRR